MRSHSDIIEGETLMNNDFKQETFPKIDDLITEISECRVKLLEVQRQLFELKITLSEQVKLTKPVELFPLTF